MEHVEDLSLRCDQSTPLQADSDMSTPMQADTLIDLTLSTPRLADTIHGANRRTPQEDSELWRTIRDELGFQNEDIANKLQNQLTFYLDGKDEIPEELTNGHNLLMDPSLVRSVERLHEIVKRMVTTGFENVCLDDYGHWRTNFLTVCLQKLGFGMSSFSMDVNDDNTIMKWIKASNIVFKILLPRERGLCDRIFLGLSLTADRSFMEVSRNLTMELLTSADEFSFKTRFFSLNNDSLKYFGNIVKVYETLHALNPEFVKLFSDQCSVSLKNAAYQTWSSLEGPMTGIFHKLENMISNNNGLVNFNGGICPIVEQVMNHLSACREAKSSWLLVRILRIMQNLKSHLEGKSKTFMQPALACIFKMNNLQLIEKKVKEYELGTILEVDLIEPQIERLRLELQLYCESSWDQVLGILNLDTNMELQMTAESLIEKLNSFDTNFWKKWEVQHKWVIIDENLREEVITSLENVLLPPYGIFLGQFETVVGKHADQYILYTIFDIQDLLKHTFNGRFIEALASKDEGRNLLI